MNSDRQRQTAAARAARSRKYEERLARVLADRGWLVLAPEVADELMQNGQIRQILSQRRTQ